MGIIFNLATGNNDIVNVLGGSLAIFLPFLVKELLQSNLLGPQERQVFGHAVLLSGQQAVSPPQASPVKLHFCMIFMNLLH
ncbi:hypothetical protein [Paraflavitalea pollutisoli]|uniref:hypothetical protein n=1 Tax=Paraflavitalea pollutisoli TaxID=3034143 RepID=UPI0023EB9FD5|nr:hypothetical protein [Paraflavitalea sp. H1-2-19X]